MTPNPKILPLRGYKIYHYHSKELQYRFFYLLLTWCFTFAILFFNMEFLLYKFSFAELSGLHLQSLVRAAEFKFSSDIHDENAYFLIKDLHIQLQNLLLTNEESLLSRSLSFNHNLQELINTFEPKSISDGYIFTEIFEAFFSYLLFASYLALLLSLPFIYYHLYKFLLPGLSYSEAKLSKAFFLLSFVLIFFAHVLTYYLVLPYAMSFFLNFQADFGLSSAFKLTEMPTSENLLATQSGVTFLGRIYPWITFLINLFTVVSVLFQLPLFLFTLFLILTPLRSFSFNLRANWQSQAKQTATSYSTKPSPDNQLSPKESPLSFPGFTLFQFNTTFTRKLLFFSLVLLTALFSPPDLYSQVFLFLPLFLIIEIFLFAVVFYLEYLNQAHSLKNQS